MGTAGYLISRAAEQPAVLSLTVAIVGVRFFGLTRPLLRYFERLSAHDLALRTLGRARRRVYERIEPLAPAQLGDWRDGDLLARLVADVDALQNLYLRGIGPPLVALTAGVVSVSVAAAILPAAAIVLAVGLLTGGIAVPAAAVAMGRRTGRLEAAARGELTAELVETLRGAPEFAVYGRADDASRDFARPIARSCALPGAPPSRTGRGRGEAARHRCNRRRRAGRRSLGPRVGEPRPRPHGDAGTAGARLVRGGPAPCAGGSGADRDARGRPASPRADGPRAHDLRSRRARPASGRALRSPSKVSARAIGTASNRSSTASTYASTPAAGWLSSARAAPARRPLRTSSSASSTRSRTGHARRARPPRLPAGGCSRRIAVAGQDSHLFSI